MTQQIINIGVSPNDGTGDQLRVSFDKCNQNFTELYTTGAGSVIEGQWNFNQVSTDTSTSPTSGRFRTNTGNFTTATQLAIHQTTINGIDRSNVLRNQLVGDLIQCQDPGDADSWCRYRLISTPVNNGTWFQIDVALEGSGGTAPGNNREILFTFAASSGGGGGGGITDAPSDGKTYGRLNAAWTDLALAYQPIGNYQPLDGDLTAIAGLTGINVIYYRSAADTWSAVTIGTGLSFAGGTLSSTVSTAGLAPLASPVFTGDPQAPTPATADNDTSIATTAFVKAQGYLTGNQTVTLSGDVTGAGATAIAATIANNAVSNAKLADMATARLRGRVTAGTGDPEDLTGTQATALLDVVTSSLKGLAPASGGGTTNFLRADATWAPLGALVGVTDGSNAPAGYVGEFLESIVSSNVAQTAAAWTNLTSLSLTAGDWDVWGGIYIIPGATGAHWAAISNANNTAPVEADLANNYISTGATAWTLSVGPTRVSTAATVTRFLNFSLAGGAGAGAARGWMRARRRR